MIFDRTQRSVVAVCECGARDLFNTQDEADSWAIAHLAVCTDILERSRALTASRVRESRHAHPPR